MQGELSRPFYRAPSCPGPNMSWVELSSAGDGGPSCLKQQHLNEASFFRVSLLRAGPELA